MICIFLKFIYMLKFSSGLIATSGEKLLRQWTSENGTAIKISDIISAYSHACASVHGCTDWEMI